MRIWTRKSALIQPRPNLGKSDGVVAARLGPGLDLQKLGAAAEVPALAGKDEKGVVESSTVVQAKISIL